MEAIWDKDGSHTGWWDRDSGAIFDSEAQRHLGFASQGGVYKADGGSCGHLIDGFFVDAEGKPVAFVEGATGGPSLPWTGGAPYVSSTPYVNPPYLSSPGWAPPLNSSWSDMNFTSLFG